MSTLCGPKRHVYWVNSGCGPGVAQNTKCVRGYCEWRLNVHFYFLIELFSGQGGQLARELLRGPGERELHGQVWYSDVTQHVPYPVSAPWYWPMTTKCPQQSGVCLFCKTGTHQQLYFRKLQPLPVHVSRKWESFSLNFDLLMWAISLFPKQLAICVIINKGCWPLTSYLPSLNNNFSKIGHVNHTFVKLRAEFFPGLELH